MYCLGYNDLKVLLIADKYILGSTKTWLDQGSLLGITRDKKFIEWDNDIDISCKYEDKPEITLGTIQKLLEYDYLLLTSKYDYTLKKLNASKDDKKLDITFIHKKNDVFYKSYSDYKQQNLIARIFEKTIKESTEILRKIHNKKVKLGAWFFINTISFIYRSYIMKTVDMVCPNWQFDMKMVPVLSGLNSVFIYVNPEPYLEYKFGRDWKTPKREWDYTSEDGGVKRVENTIS